MEKKVINRFGEHYLLGADEYGIRYYMKKESWDCGWYWGFGYVRTFTNNKNPQLSKDIASHQHFDGMFFNQNKCGYDAFKEFFVETPLTDDEIWELVDLMRTAYTLQESAELFGRGYSHYTSKAKLDVVVNEDYVENINHTMIPAVMDRVRDILTKEAK